MSSPDSPSTDEKQWNLIRARVNEEKEFSSALEHLKTAIAVKLKDYSGSLTKWHLVFEKDDAILFFSTRSKPVALDKDGECMFIRFKPDGVCGNLDNYTYTDILKKAVVEIQNDVLEASQTLRGHYTLFIDSTNQYDRDRRHLDCIVEMEALNVLPDADDMRPLWYMANKRNHRDTAAWLAEATEWTDGGLDIYDALTEEEYMASRRSYSTVEDDVEHMLTKPLDEFQKWHSSLVKWDWSEVLNIVYKVANTEFKSYHWLSQAKYKNQVAINVEYLRSKGFISSKRKLDAEEPDADEQKQKSQKETDC